MRLQSFDIPTRTIDVAAGSIIMAMGIFILGALHQFPILEKNFGLIFSVLLILFWFIMLGFFVTSLFNKEYRLNLIHSPISSFGVGTWIAGTSVICILMINQMPELFFIIRILIYVNLLCWLLFIFFCGYQLKKIIVMQSTKEVHGVILLSTVSTQSISLLLLNYFHNIESPYFVILIICIGNVFYLFSIGLLILRFISKFHKIHEWKNTDCIIHGALSITGLAMTQTGVFPVQILMIVWYTVFGLFIVIETIEVIRGYKRIKDYGIRRGIFTYHITQWARNFTFGMFYFFTFNIVKSYSNIEPFVFQKNFMTWLGWVVLILLIIEVGLLITSKLRWDIE
ncbi:voltage-gated anion channel [Ureibacillus xyleni]|uniref:Voltage-gated anion channel n=1 Tax=Ureibacillus xyleni TaxID=614648 RepID=A0A285S587_9BACL|nr:hypothetical protein [Ureibacillus xyleni]SOC00074.1 voltage-gated anion channel [Ureibacillus xyleni]